MTMSKVLVACAFVLGAVGCGSPAESADTSTEQNATSCAETDVAPAASTASSRQVSFSSDVLPIFATSCSFGSCHGATRGDNNGVFLGTKAGNTSASAIRDALVGHPSKQSPSTPYVTPADPSRSYLIRKLEGTMCGLADCSAGNCGQTMPRGGDKLDDASLDLVRTWIMQGATDN
ncbi:MAG: hypothetical protein JWP87_2000 [Labilithrix sp.]|nr:hypothetical protein [Labilithrix sp.]